MTSGHLVFRPYWFGVIIPVDYRQVRNSYIGTMLHIFITILFSINVQSNHQPQQVHISYGGDSREIIVTWTTENRTKTPTVNYGIGELSKTSLGTCSLFIDGGKQKRNIWIHRVHLKPLMPNSKYVYNCGSNEGWSTLFSFKTVKSGTDFPVKLALYGDLGVENHQSLSRLQLETEKGFYDVILHIGDFAYDMHDNNGRIGDIFMNSIEPIAANVPYMVCPGNHEEAYNFSNYRARFTMPNYDSTENLFYSWNIGLVHFISINTEAYYFINYGIKILISQYSWLIKDLEAANEASSRAKRPWIVMYGHRPMYCSNTDKDDCTRNDCVLRVGLPLSKWFGIEHLLKTYDVDLAVWAHEHSYERLWPLYDFHVLNGSYSEPYVNPRGPVHITTGSAGNRERRSPFIDKQPYWSAFRSEDYGYTRLYVLNKTHLYWEQVSDDKNGEVIDKTWLVKYKHGSYHV